MTIRSHQPLRQGDCKNAFQQSILPPDKITTICPPSRDPESALDKYWLLKRTLYGLWCRPHHWYDKISAILQSIGHTPLLKDLCLYTNFVHMPLDPLSAISSAPLSLRLYVDNFVYFLEDHAIKALSVVSLLSVARSTLWGLLNGFLAFIFLWHITPTLVANHLDQSGFATSLIKSFVCQTPNKTPTAAPYCSGIPINSIVPSLNANNSSAQVHCKDAYQSLIGSIGWLLSTTRPDLTVAHSFLSSYMNKPASRYIKDVFYILHYIHSTHDQGISFTSNDIVPMHSYVHFPPPTNVEAYDDAVPSTLG